MKFTLVLIVCSFLPGQAMECFPPLQFPTLYDSWYECSRDAHRESIKVLSTFGFKRSNELQLGTKYYCQQSHIY